jgi:hypothetical protein
MRQHGVSAHYLPSAEKIKTTKVEFSSAAAIVEREKD